MIQLPGIKNFCDFDILAVKNQNVQNFLAAKLELKKFIREHNCVEVKEAALYALSAMRFSSDADPDFYTKRKSAAAADKYKKEQAEPTQGHKEQTAN